MQPRNYRELQRAPASVQRKTYGWAIEIGPLLIRPDIHDPTRRFVINYYWKRKYIFTSAKRYIIWAHSGCRYIIGFWNRRIRLWWKVV